MVKHNINIAFEEYQTFEELNESDKALCLEAEKALSGSHSPYSNFKVGAALRLKSGRIVYGSNQENAAYPSGLCAERTALFGLAGSHLGPPPLILGMSVAGRPAQGEFAAALPCGACRQVMLEAEMRQGQPIWLLLPGPAGTVLRFERLADLLPFHFSPSDLPPRL